MWDLIEELQQLLANDEQVASAATGGVWVGAVPMPRPSFPLVLITWDTLQDDYTLAARLRKVGSLEIAAIGRLSSLATLAELIENIDLILHDYAFTRGIYCRRELVANMELAPGDEQLTRIAARYRVEMT